MSENKNIEKRPKLLGILGGMGPAATIDFMKNILDLTKASTDQDHIPTITYNNTQVPDRNEAYLRNGESPLPELLKSAEVLFGAGVDLIAIPCNTAHIWFDDLKKSAKGEILNMIEISVNEIPEGSKVGIISTTPVRLSGLYSKPLEERGCEVVLPEDQEKIMRAIYLVKAGDLDKARGEFKNEVKKLEEKGIKYLLAGCTEVPVALSQKDIAATMIDPMKKLAEECLRRFGKL